MAEPTSSCARSWGMCLGDPRCADRLCPAHPVNDCNTCRGDGCYTPIACQVPMAELPMGIQRNLFTSVGRFFPSTPEARGRWIGGSLGLAGCLYLSWHVLRYLQLI